jgi:hypothetical protein
VPARSPEVIPVPERETLTLEFAALLLMVAVALNGPAALGVNATVTVALCPTATVAGNVGAVTAKLLLDKLIALTVTDCEPLFTTVMLSGLVAPTTTLPKSRLLPLSDKLPGCSVVVDVLGPALSPAQPARNEMLSSSNSVLAALQIVGV